MQYQVIVMATLDCVAFVRAELTCMQLGASPPYQYRNGHYYEDLPQMLRGHHAS